jgi:hypothetical protein
MNWDESFGLHDTSSTLNGFEHVYSVLWNLSCLHVKESQLHSLPMRLYIVQVIFGPPILIAPAASVKPRC